MVQNSAPIVASILAAVDYLAPIIKFWFICCYDVYSKLSSNVSRVIYGLLISFFGGSFPVAISVRYFIESHCSHHLDSVGTYCHLIQAAEALRLSGGERVQTALIDLYTDYELFLQAEEEESKKEGSSKAAPDVRGPERTASSLCSRRPTLSASDRFRHLESRTRTF